MSTPEKNKKHFKIGIIEIYSHHVFVHTLASIALKCNMDVTIYTVPRIHADLEPLFANNMNKITWSVSNKGESDWKYLKRIRHEIENDFDLLFINTIQGIRVGLFYLINFKIKTVVGAGRISEFFGIKYKLSGFTSLRRLLHHNYTRFLLKRCIPRYEGIIIHTNQAKEFALTHNYKKTMIQLPFSLYKGGVKLRNTPDSLNFVVTGSIVESCRDHIGVLNAFENLWSSGLNNISLTILSSPRTSYGYKVLERMKILKDSGYDITYFSGWIDEKIFLKEAEQADFFISPLNLNYYSCGELTSGIVEVIRQGKPGIYPAGYLPDPTIESSSLFYNHIDELSLLIRKLIENDSLVNELSTNAIKNSEAYSLESVSNKFNDEIDNLLTHTT